MRSIRAIILLSVIWSSLPLQAGSLHVQVFDNKHEPLPDAVIYLMSGQPYKPAPVADIEIEQKNKMFQPFVTIIPTGTSASFPNRDGIGHHVYSFSPAKNFQLPLSDKVSTETITFNKPGVVTLGCNIHDWMVAYIYVVDTPYYAKADANGAAEIDNLPAGDYEIHVAHPGMRATQPVTGKITIAADGDSRQEFTLEIKPRYFWHPAPRVHEEAY